MGYVGNKVTSGWFFIKELQVSLVSHHSANPPYLLLPSRVALQPVNQTSTSNSEQMEKVP
jgi:hypothetical protein